MTIRILASVTTDRGVDHRYCPFTNVKSCTRSGVLRRTFEQSVVKFCCAVCIIKITAACHSRIVTGECGFRHTQCPAVIDGVPFGGTIVVHKFCIVDKKIPGIGDRTAVRACCFPVPERDIVNRHSRSAGNIHDLHSIVAAEHNAFIAVNFRVAIQIHPAVNGQRLADRKSRAENDPVRTVHVCSKTGSDIEPDRAVVIQIGNSLLQLLKVIYAVNGHGYFRFACFGFRHGTQRVSGTAVPQLVVGQTVEHILRHFCIGLKIFP